MTSGHDSEEHDVLSEEEMIQLGKRVGASLGEGDVLGLVGDLGAGKTHFVKGLVSGVGSAEAVTSPTFTLLHEYVGGRLPLFHFDFYRIEAEEELSGVGWDEYVEDRGGVVVAEWAEKFPELMPANTKWWRFTILGGERRRVTLEEGR